MPDVLLVVAQIVERQPSERIEQEAKDPRLVAVPQVRLGEKLLGELADKVIGGTADHLGDLSVESRIMGRVERRHQALDLRRGLGSSHRRDCS